MLRDFDAILLCFFDFDLADFLSVCTLEDNDESEDLCVDFYVGLYIVLRFLLFSFASKVLSPALNVENEDLCLVPESFVALWIVLRSLDFAWAFSLWEGYLLCYIYEKL